MTTSAPGRARRIAERRRPSKWRPAPVAIDRSVCINCDACLAACPPQFGAVFRFARSMVIIPELCSGCGKCVAPVCPVDCIYEVADWEPSPEELWDLPLSSADVYADPVRRLELTRVRRW